MDIYVGFSNKTPNYDSIAAALSSVSGGFAEDSAASAGYTPAPKHFPEEVSDDEPVTIHVAAGIYREKLVITRPNLTLSGEGRDKTVLIYGQGANEPMPDGTKRGTFRTASVRIDTHDFTAKHLTFRNDAGYGHTVGQALALYVDGDRNAFFDCSLIGSQDTLFTAPLPEKEAKPGGFKGPGESTPRVLGRHYFKNCYLQGDVDFLFGGGIALFEECEIFSKFPEDREKPEDTATHTMLSAGAAAHSAHITSDAGKTDITEARTYGYITAASTPYGQPFGYVFKNCRLTSDCPPETIYLGRPWREWAKTVYLDCEIGAHIKPIGWKDWNKPHDHFFYAEYRSYGSGAAPDKRADFSHQLTDEEAAEYTMEKILQGWTPSDSL